MSSEPNVDHLIVVEVGDFFPVNPVGGPWLKGRRTLNDALDLAKSRTEPLAKRWHPTIMVAALPITHPDCCLGERPAEPWRWLGGERASQRAVLLDA
jgi:hypothetical protein